MAFWLCISFAYGVDRGCSNPQPGSALFAIIYIIKKSTSKADVSKLMNMYIVKKSAFYYFGIFLGNHQDITVFLIALAD